MTPLSRRSRLLTIICALVQLVLPGALGVLDALSAADRSGTAAHVEDRAGKHCRAPHGDECIVCKHLSTGTTPSDPVSADLPRVAQVRPAAWVEPDRRSVARRGFSSRAPPEL